jgi:hypothetical protein
VGGGGTRVAVEEVGVLGLQAGLVVGVCVVWVLQVHVSFGYDLVLVDRIRIRIRVGRYELFLVIVVVLLVLVVECYVFFIVELVGFEFL